MSFLATTLGTFAVHEAGWLASNLPYLVAADRGWWEAYKVVRVGKAREPGSDERWALFWTILGDHFKMMLPLLALAYYPLLAHLFTADAMPSWLEALAAFVLFNVVEDTLFYWVHYALHVPRLYKAIHRKHHEHVVTFSLTGEVSHPLEFLANILVPLMAGPVLLVLAYRKVHLVEFWVWIVFRTMRGADAHSGYQLPFHPLRLLSPIYGGPAYHDHHHSIRGRQTNFGGYRFWDWLCGTYSPGPAAKAA
ncbi:C-4 methylsterol oxidase [Thecamonas trahens ATCC 50062]|uniref:C-4 methylsterol oxidase n=1 Tax=Thecamonas trahens ATCC 50062 TaxID=461836 RepID=A0A0L0D601_THETB|nr:C-4 methylsterol oxidase [Thecamonas trahens ATCC 50062]KNC46738.1 C-4 methylsterol oxidase [Thecamonas trahens ATCC 50062]|eukprot:XP_013760018.1 C-4 methylsterol oxidase [Thecamonas trahens ATCC 50062]